MSPRTAAERRAQAEKLIAPSLRRYPVSSAAHSVIVDALAIDLGAADHEAVLARDRLMKVETQTRTVKDEKVSSPTPSPHGRLPICPHCVLPMRLTSEGSHHVCYTCDACKTSGAYSVNDERHPYLSRQT
jgi:hypothetical protein